MSIQDDLTWALNQFQSNRTSEYKKYLLYYEGIHNLRFATEKFKSTFGDMFREFSENACRTVVDSLADRLEVTGFSTSQSQIVKEASTVQMPPGAPDINRQRVLTQDPLGDNLWDIWRRNRMSRKETKVHKDMLRLGDTYVIVWPGDDGKARIFPQKGQLCTVRYDDETGEMIELGSKVWYQDVEKRWYLNLYYPDAPILKYRMSNSGKETFDASPKAWEGYDSVDNPYGRVPLFHFPNAAVCEFGSSELKDIVPLQDGLNKSVMDMLVAMEFAAFRQRYVLGLEIEIDDETGEPVDPNTKNYGVDRLMAFSDPDMKVGEFGAADLDQFLRVTDKFWTSIAKISGTPLHYFFITTGDFPSGNAMRAAEGKFVNKIEDRQEGAGDIWSDVMKFASKIEGADIDSEEVETTWSDAAQPSDAEIADTAVKKKAVGVSKTQILKELDYSDDEIDQMLQESDADSMQQSMLKAQENPPFGGGGGGGSGIPGLNPNGQPIPGPNQRPGKGVKK